MLQGRNKKTIIIGILFCLLAFMGVGFAALSTTIDIYTKAKVTGSWNVKITKITVKSETGLAKANRESISFTDTTAQFSHELYAPGDSVEYEITIENKGNIKAALKQITATVTPKYDDLILTNSLSQGEILDGGEFLNNSETIQGGEKLTFTIKSEFDINATKLPDTQISPKYELEMIFHQYQGNQIITPPDFSTDNVCFTVANDGTLLDYDYNCGLNVKVPASIDGINITKLTTASFDTHAKILDDVGISTSHSYQLYNPYYAYGSQSYFFVDSKEKIYDLAHVLSAGYTPAFLAVNTGWFVTDKSVEETYVYNSTFIYGIDADGYDAYENAEYIIYEYYDPDWFYVVDSEEALGPARIWAENMGIDPSMVYLAGSDDIPYPDEYRTPIMEVYEMWGEGESDIYFNDVTFDYNISSFITGLDLSEAIYLQEINTQNKFSGLQTLILPQNGSLTTIGTRAFAGNSKKTKVDIPSTVTTIGDFAFYGSSADCVINVNRLQSGMTLGNQWNGNAKVNFYP